MYQLASMMVIATSIVGCGGGESPNIKNSIESNTQAVETNATDVINTGALTNATDGVSPASGENASHSGMTTWLSDISNNLGVTSTIDHFLSTALKGTWVMPCYYINHGGVNFYSEFTFDEQQFTRWDYRYAPSDTECSAPTHTERTSYAVNRLTAAINLKGHAHLDLQPISYSSSAFSSNVEPSDLPNDYTLLALRGRRLYFADMNSGDGRNPETRPTAIDYSVSFGKKSF